MGFKLVIWDAQWAAYQHRFAAALGSGWRIAAGTEAGWLAEEIIEADALIALRLPEAVLPRAVRLKAFLFPGAGILEPDPSRYPAGCAVSNVSEHAAAVAEYILAAILLQATGILRYREALQQGRWEGSGRLGGQPHRELRGRTLGLVGYGAIGQATCLRARAFGMRVLAIRQHPELPLAHGAPRPHFLGGPRDLDRLLEESDYLVLACPLTEATRGMIGEAELRRTKPGAVLVNVARAEIVEEKPLYEALCSGRLGGAVLDVWYRYPDPAPKGGYGSALPFHELPNVLATPHMAGWTEETIERRIKRMVENLKRLERGEPLERVVFIGSWKVPVLSEASP